MTRTFIFLFIVSIVSLFFPVYAEAASCPVGVGGSEYCKVGDSSGIYQCVNDIETQVGVCAIPRICQQIGTAPANCTVDPAFTTATPVPTTAAAQAVPTATAAPGGHVVTRDFLWDVDPLVIGIPSVSAQGYRLLEFSTPAAFMNTLLKFIFPLAGMILFIQIVWGGFEMILSVNDAKSFDTGKQRVTSALTGFVLLFASYWLAQIVQQIFGVNILG